jgi:hypothetical protein
MLNVDLDIWAEDLRQLGREYFALVRQLIGEDAPEAARIFGFRRPEAMYLLFRMSSEQLDTALAVSGLPFGVGDEASLAADLRNLDVAKPRYSLPTQMTAAAESLQMAYYERLRTVARDNAGEAASLFCFGDLHRVITPVSELTLSGLRKLSRLNHALTINSNVGMEMVHSLIATGASAERIAIAGWTANSSRGQGDLSLTGKFDLSDEVKTKARGQMQLLENVV